MCLSSGTPAHKVPSTWAGVFAMQIIFLTQRRGKGTPLVFWLHWSQCLVLRCGSVSVGSICARMEGNPQRTAGVRCLLCCVWSKIILQVVSHSYCEICPALSIQEKSPFFFWISFIYFFALNSLCCNHVLICLFLLLDSEDLKDRTYCTYILNSRMISVDWMHEWMN